MHISVRVTAVALLAALFGAQQAAAQVRCPVVDIESIVEDVATQSAGLPMDQRIAAYRSRIVSRFRPVYAPSVFGMQDGPRFEPWIDQAIGQSLPDANDPRRPLVLREFRSSFETVEAAFRNAFPKFRCDFPIYAMDSLGTFDGAGRIVGGRPALVIGIDRLVAEQKMISMSIFLTHELFHRYHFSRAGFSDDPGEHQAIWRALWAEGLATYMSYRLTPGATIEDVLMLPSDMASRAGPQVAALAGRMLGHLDQTDADTFKFFFTFGAGDGPSAGVPWRTGYYIGFLVAQDLGRNHSLAELSELKGEPLRQAIAGSLRRLAAPH